MSADPDRDETASGSPVASGEIPSGSQGFVGRWLGGFVGRLEERRALAGLLAAPAGVVAVIGPAGIGKSRLVDEVLRGQPAPVVWVELEGVTEQAELDRRLLGPAEGLGGADPVGRALAMAPEAWWVLDGLDAPTLRAAVKARLPGWRARTARLRLLVTARAPLEDVAGGRSLVLGPLAVGGIASDPSGEPSEAARLCLAVAARRGLEPSALAVTQAEALGARLGGLPLAIELAVARLRLMSPAALLAHLEAVGPGRGLGEPLARAIENSLAGLSGAARRCLECLQVFCGGFTVEAAAAVLGATDATLDLERVLELLSELMDHGLVVRRAAASPGASPRLELLGCLREVASSEGPAASALRRAHAEWFAAEAQRQQGRLSGDAGGEARAWFMAEAANLDRALSAATQAQPPAAALAWSLVATLDARAQGWSGTDFDPARVASLPATPSAARGWLAVGFGCARSGRLERAEWAFAQVEALATGEPELEIRVLVGQATLLDRRGAHAQAIAVFDQALARLGAEEAASVQGWALAGRGLAEVHRRAFDAGAADLRAAVARFEAAADHYGAAVARGNLAVICARLGQEAAAEAYATEAARYVRAQGPERIDVNLRSNQAWWRLSRRDLAGAAAIYAELAGAVERQGDPLLLAANRMGRGLLGALAGDLDGAHAHYRRALEASRIAPSRTDEVECLACLAAIEASQGLCAEAHDRLALAQARAEGLAGWAQQAPIYEAILELAGWRALRDAGDLEGARGRVRAARGASGSLARRAEAGDTRWPPDPCRRALMLLDAACVLAAAALEICLPPAPREGLQIEPGCAGVWLPGGELMDLRRRPLSRRLMQRLVAAREAQPGVGLDLDAIWAAGWGEERIQEHSRRNRIYVAIADLRARGLGAILRHQADGYLLDAQVPIRWR